ncbi:MAG: GlpM family protein [Alphaproteobacteria bacterium]|nr:GlpM family protein [Alphaproteobacteria bacterium]
MMLYYTCVGLAGAFISVLLAMLSRTNLYLISGIIIFFPTFTLLSLIFNNKRSAVELGNLIQFMMVSMLPYFAFIGCMYVLSPLMNFYVAVGLSLIVWLIAAIATYLVYNRITG